MTRSDEHAIYEGEDPQRGIAMPFVVRIEDHVNDAELTVRFRELHLNVDVVPDSFQQVPPGGMAVERAECDPN